jgi:hypothetical protein
MEVLHSLKDLGRLKQKIVEDIVNAINGKYSGKIKELEAELEKLTAPIDIKKDSSLIKYKNHWKKSGPNEFTVDHLVLKDESSNNLPMFYYDLELKRAVVFNDVRISVEGAQYKIRTPNHDNYSICQKISLDRGIPLEEEFDEKEEFLLYGLEYEKPFIVLNVGYKRFLEVFSELGSKKEVISAKQKERKELMGEKDSEIKKALDSFKGQK